MQKQDKQTVPEARVGIFWLFHDKLIIDSTPVSKAEPYGSAMTHPTGHVDYWTRLQHSGVVPAEVEYEEPPRGRVMYDKRDERFHLYADKCILGHKNLVRQIMITLNLPPKQTSTGRDEHYRCSKCLSPAVDEEDDF